MEIKELKTYLPLMHSLGQCRDASCRNIIMSHLDDPSFKFVNSWITKGVQTPDKLKLSPNRMAALRSVLSRDKVRIKYLTGQKGVIKRKKAAVRQSGKGIGVLLGILAPLVINLVKDLIAKKKK